MRATLRRYYGIGLDDVLTGAVSVDEAWDLLMHAPRDSPVISAIADDPLYARAPGRAGAPKLTQFSPERESLAAIHDLLAALLTNVIALGGGKPPKLKPHPRPVTASARSDEDGARKQHQELVKRLMRPKVTDSASPPMEAAGTAGAHATGVKDGRADLREVAQEEYPELRD